jgi:hypothetical protein
LFYVVANLFEATPKIVRLQQSELDGPLLGPLILFTVMMRVARVLNSLWGSAFPPTEQMHEAVRLLLMPLDSYRAICLREETSKLDEKEKLAVTVDKFRSSSADLARQGKRTKVLTDRTNSDSRPRNATSPPAKRHRSDIADDLALSSDDDDTTVPKPSADVKPTGASADGGACAAPAAAAAAAPAAAEDPEVEMCVDGNRCLGCAALEEYTTVQKDAVNIVLVASVRRYEPVGTLFSTDTLELDHMVSNHHTALRSLNYELEKRREEEQRGLQRDNRRRWHGPYAPGQDRPRE